MSGVPTFLNNLHTTTYQDIWELFFLGATTYIIRGIMEPNHNTAPGPAEALPAVSPSESLPEPEQIAAAPERTSAPQAPPIAATPVAQPSNPVAVPTTGIPAPPVMTDAMIADDADLIEKEWVERAKAIVMQTKNDPHLQNKEINKVKAAYVKKRYNKDLKVNEE